ncbi:MAG: TspO/MBR family protein, partial [Pseudomonadota bacterium]
GAQSIGGALVLILAILIAVAITTIAFWRKSVLAGALLIPYLAWVGFATFLNFTIWRLNS